MVAGSAGHDADAPDVPDVSVGHGQVAEYHASVADAARDGAAHRRRLLVYLLEHKVVVAALFRRGNVPVDVVMLLLDGAAALVVNADAVGGDHRQLAIVHVDNVAGVGQQRRHIRGQEVLTPGRSPAAAVRPSGRR